MGKEFKTPMTLLVIPEDKEFFNEYSKDIPKWQAFQEAMNLLRENKSAQSG